MTKELNKEEKEIETRFFDNKIDTLTAMANIAVLFVNAGDHVGLAYSTRLFKLPLATPKSLKETCLVTVS